MHRLLRRGVLAAAPWPLVHACSKPQLARAYPRATALRAVYLGLYAAAVTSCAVLLPWLLVPVGAVAAAGASMGLWLMRPGAGRARGLPEGPLSLLPVRQFVDEWFLERQAQRFGAVSKTTWPTLKAPVVCIQGLRSAADVLREHPASLRGVGIAFDQLIPAGFLRNMEPGDHARYKPLFRTALADSVVEARRADFDAEAVAALAAMAAEKNGRVDPRPHLVRASVTALVPLMLGVEPGSAEAGRAIEIYEGMGEFFEPPLRDSAKRRACLAAVDELEQVLAHGAARALEALRAGCDPMPSLPAELARSRPDALDDPNVTRNLVLVLRTASVDVASLEHWIVKMLGEHPEWCRHVRADASGDVARRVVLETLRLHQSEFIQRRVLEPFRVGGYDVPAGWFIRVCVRESHRDPAVFPEPTAFDPDRFAGRRFSRYEYSPFGRLEHGCIGETVTLELAGSLVRRLCDGYEWSIVEDGPPEFNRYHWRPSRRFRIRLEPRR